MNTPFARSAAVVAIGDEICCGAQADLNSSVIASRLFERGWSVEEMHALPDDEERLAALFAELGSRRALVVTTGGLGPTLDDVTRHAAARAAGVPLLHSAEAMGRIRAWFEAHSRRMPDSNERQALVPEGAALLHNQRGTAPGFRLGLGRAQLFVLPGPPTEMRRMLECDVLPWVEAHAPAGDVFRAGRLHLFGLSESVFAERAGDWMDREANPRMGVTVRAGVITIHLRAHAPTEAEAEALLEERSAAAGERFAEHLFSTAEGDLAFVLGRRLLEEGITVATAESCTGGLVAQRLTRVPGISAVFLEGFVTYANEAKIQRLGVPAELLERHGAVSRETAEALARGAAERAGVRAAVSVTGVAGPGGGTPEKPVGLVWFGACVDGRVTSLGRRFPAGSRNFVRDLAANAALAHLLRSLPS